MRYAQNRKIVPSPVPMKLAALYSSGPRKPMTYVTRPITASAISSPTTLRTKNSTASRRTDWFSRSLNVQNREPR